MAHLESPWDKRSSSRNRAANLCGGAGRAGEGTAAIGAGQAAHRGARPGRLRAAANRRPSGTLRS